jgi:hypothetical protein
MLSIIKPKISDILFKINFVFSFLVIYSFQNNIANKIAKKNIKTITTGIITRISINKSIIL